MLEFLIMPELLSMDSKNNLPPAQDYNFLKKEGIRYIEDLAGKLWTDFNTHDPGITLLEAMCYALTDLGYRTSFEIADIIAPPVKTSADKWKNIFYTARQALPCNPLTLIDYRKLIIDTEGVRNAWVEISDDYEVLIYLQKMEEDSQNTQSYKLTYDVKNSNSVLRMRGLYKVFVEYEDDIQEQKREDEIAKVIWQKLHFHRNITEDFIGVSSVEYEDFPIEAIIQVNEGTDIEMINAQIYKVIYDFFSPPISFYSLEQMLEKKGTAEEVFDGPVLNYGFIDTEELVKSERFKNIHLSDIINIISGIDGVIAVTKFTFQSDSKSPFINFSEWINNAKDKQKMPRLDIKGSTVIFERSGDRHREEDKRQINKERVEVVFSFLNSDNFKTRLRSAGKDLPIPEGEYMNLAEYYPFQKDLPAVYGMTKTFVNDKDNVDKMAIAKAINELVSEKAGVHMADLLTMFLIETRHQDYLETMIEDILNNIKFGNAALKKIADDIWEKEIDEKYFKNIIRQLLGNDIKYTSDKNYLIKYVEQSPVYKTASYKSYVLNNLASNEIMKNLVKIKSTGDVAKLNSHYKIYQIGMLDKDKKMVLQLRGFLMVFEQILADYLSQLSHLREIFSFSDEVLQNTYPQLVEGVNDMEALFIDFKQYHDHHLEMQETTENFNDKRNDILNHLMARFGESMNRYAFFMRQFAGKEAQEKLVTDKVNFLADYIQVSSYRGKGVNYADENNNWNSSNVEGLKKRICRLLGISNYKREKISPGELFTEKIILDNNVVRYIVKLADTKNKNEILLISKDFEFENEALTLLTYLLEEGYNRDLYKEEGHSDKWSFVLNRLTPENNFESIAYSPDYTKSNDRNKALEKVIKTFNDFSEAENFHMLEHILLRPKIGARQKGAITEEVALLPVEYVPNEINAANASGTEMPYKFKIVQIKDPTNMVKNLWKLSLLKNEVEFLKINENFIFYKDLTNRMEHIRRTASDSASYITEMVDGQYIFKITAGNSVLAESKRKFQNTDNIDVEIKALVDFLSYESGLISGMVNDNDPALYADPYSFQISIILPAWQRRFRNTTFKHLLEKTIYLETPSHVYPHIYWANHHQMKEFDEAYEVWVKEIASNGLPATDVVNNMITVLNSLKT